MGADENKLRYAYYRLMFQHHPDRNPTNPSAHELTALINEAFGLLTGRRSDALLLKRDFLVEKVTGCAVVEAEGLLSYEEWLKQQFYNPDEGSIWAY